MDPRLSHEYRQQTPGYSEYVSKILHELFPTPIHLLEAFNIPLISDAASLAIAVKDNSKLGMGLGILGALPFVPGNIIKKAPYDTALELAQRHAALPVSEGGLGLRLANTPAERAKAMGFTTPAWRGTTADEYVSRRALDGNFGAGHYSGFDPNVALDYAADEGDFTGGNIMPLLLRGEYATNAEFDAAEKVIGYDWDKVEAFLKAKGKAGVADDVYEGAYLTWDPANIRSKFAAFDPFRSTSPNLLAGLAPYITPALLSLSLWAMTKSEEAKAQNQSLGE